MELTPSKAKEDPFKHYHMIPKSQRFDKNDLARLYQLVEKETDDTDVEIEPSDNTESCDGYSAKAKKAQLHLLLYKVLSYLLAEDSRLMNEDMEKMFG